MQLANRKLASAALILIATVALSGCSHWSKSSRNTAIGATAGAVGGAVLTGGSTLGVLGGAAAGGVIGHAVSK